MSWGSSSVTVINPNKTLCKHFKKVDDYIKNACYENNINIENDLVLEEVRKVYRFLFRMIVLLFLDTRDQDNLLKNLTINSTL